MQILDEPLFWGPILILAMGKLGHMSATEIFLSEMAAMGLVLLLDAPSGILADKWGRKRCVIIGKVFTLLYVATYACMDSPMHSYIANVFWAIGVSLRSGAESALIYDELRRRGETECYAPLMKSVHSTWFFISSITTLLTGFIAEIDLRLPLLLSIPLVCVSLFLTFLFPKEDRHVDEVHTLESYFTHTKEAITAVKSNRTLMVLIFWIAVVGMLGKINFFAYNPYLESVGVPYSHVGIIFALMNAAAFIASRYAMRMHAWLGRVGFGYWLMLQGGILLVQAAYPSQLLGWAFILFGIRWGYMNTIIEPILHSHIESARRATVLSFQSSFGGLLQIVGFLLTAFIAVDVITLITVLGVTALILGVISRKL